MHGEFLRRRCALGARLALATVAVVTWGAPPIAAAPVSIDYLTGLSVAQIQTDYAANLYTPLELTEAYLARIAKYEPIYNAYVTMNPAALSDAIDKTNEMGAPGFVPGPLFGVPIAIKDPMDVAGLRTTVGSTAFGAEAGGIEMIPETDAPLVARLRAAGAIILGKTNVPDFSRTGSHSTSSLAGATHNAYNPARTPGGSSGGSAVAVATGMAVLATAEETGSSITNPSSAASIVGIKPTFGTVPSAGVFPLAGYFRDTDGQFGKTVLDAALMYDIMAGPSYEDPKPHPSAGAVPPGGFVNYIEDHPTALSGARIGVFGPGYSGTTLTPETQALFEAELDVLEAAGATLVADPFAGTDYRTLLSGVPNSGTFTFDVQEYLKRLGPSAAFNSIEEYETLTGNNWYGIEDMPGESSPLDPAIRPELDAYRERREAIRGLFKLIMDENDLDALVMPQLAAPVPELGGGGIQRTPGSGPNIMGTPGIVIPGGYYSDGTPFAMYFMGDLNNDAQVIALGYHYEQITMHRVAPSLVPEPASVVLLAGAFGVVAFGPRRRAA
jgi:Asp-tRNA(Asn)/Glu-tRNA(Gln) amidotransferase A subunit family amidase